MDIPTYLQTVDISSARAFVPAITCGRVVKVYDGDTITVVSPFCNGASTVEPELFLFRVRLRGIDSPELRGTLTEEHCRAIASRDALSELVMNRVVRIANVGSEKYGRLLADVYIDDVHVNNWMIDNGFAARYFGGTKTD